MILPLSLGAMVHTHLCLACGFAVGALTCPSASQDIAPAKNPGVPDAELSFHSRGKAPPDLWWISLSSSLLHFSCRIELAEVILPERAAETHGSCFSKSSWLLPGEIRDLDSTYRCCHRPDTEGLE